MTPHPPLLQEICHGHISPSPQGEGLDSDGDEVLIATFYLCTAGGQIGDIFADFFDFGRGNQEVQGYAFGVVGF